MGYSMLIHQENDHRISEYEAVLFYAGRAARSHCDARPSYSYIITIIAKLEATGKGRSLQLECQAVDIWIVVVRDRRPEPALRL